DVWPFFGQFPPIEFLHLSATCWEGLHQREGQREIDIHRVEEQDALGERALPDPIVGYKPLSEYAECEALAAASLTHDVEDRGSPGVEPDVAKSCLSVLANVNSFKLTRTYSSHEQTTVQTFVDR